MPSRDKNLKRYSGVLCAISSLPSPHGIGSFGVEAYKFIDFLCDAKQRFWQILPLNPLGEGDSPYKSSSTFAGEILYIDLKFLVREGLLDDAEGKCEFSQNVDYDAVRKFKLPLFQKAAQNFDTNNKNYKSFLSENEFWLDDYALFEAALQVYKTQYLKDLPGGIKYRVPDEINKFKEQHKDKINFYKITQYFFFCQYYDLKRYANGKGIKIIGDIPFYVSPDSADVWANPDDFKVGRDFTPTAVAGVPPDVFSENGQLWGNPIYNWHNIKRDGYRWWQSRLSFCRRLYDVLRIDHFRAFANYYSIPYGSKTAMSGAWIAGEGKAFWDRMREQMGDINIIAEDLGGEEDPQVIELLNHTDFPNMKILQFGFTGDMQNMYLPQNYPYNCVCYTGTHDNDTALGWYNKASTKERVIFNTLIRNNTGCIAHDMIRALSKSNSMLCIIPMQDVLCLDSSARMNTPGTIGDNWTWRVTGDDINPDNAKLLKKLTKERN